MLILKCFNISILNGLRSNYLKHLSILSSYQTFSKRNYILETTKIKFLNGYEDSLNYVKHMKNERNKLAELVNNESQLDNYDNKQKLFQRLNDLNQISAAHDKIIKCQNDIKESSEMLAKMKNDAEKDDEMFKLINDDLIKLNENLTELKFDLINLLIPDEIEDKEDAVLELSAGVGGLESRIFCSELFEMYRLYSANREWSFTPINIYSDQTEMGEMMRGAIIDITGKDVYKWLKFESGVHRVQRVPKTESKGRIHTSTVGVVVTPKPANIEIEINPKDLKIEVKTSGGPGGQHANKTQSAVRLTHLPTGIVIYNDEERHQYKNRAKAMKNLQQKLYQRAYEEQLNKRQSNRKMQVGTSSRSERIRTYNFIQDRITDHRLGENFHSIPKFLNGDTLDEMINSLRNEQKVEILYEMIDKFNNEAKK